MGFSKFINRVIPSNSEDRDEYNITVRTINALIVSENG